ncbi:hypothetical protein ACIRRA_34015 [Nocardia sp. NPDC101769]|uniref:hypothetical protein n=1 Tax=Nocardia sp. NPDC101769 TaxID=3364333 RepID=UPI0037F20B70
MLDTVMNEDPTEVGYRLIRTETNGKIDFYGSTQERKDDKVPDESKSAKSQATHPAQTITNETHSMVRLMTNVRTCRIPR